MRRRNTVLQGLEHLRQVAPALTLGQILVLLYIADEEDPLPLIDIRWRANLPAVQVWRHAQALAKEGLVSLGRWKMGAIVAAQLSPAGEQLRAELDDIILRSDPIQPALAPRAHQAA